MEPVEVLWDGDGVPLPQGGEQTNEVKIYPTVVLRTRTVTS